MIGRLVRVSVVAGCLLAASLLTVETATAQTKIKPGFNLFSVEQDKEIGAKSAAEVERQFPILHGQAIDSCVDAIGKRLAAVAPGAKYAYQFEVVNASDVNAFALPGGYLYFNRGLVETAKSEGQLAGVMAHEMAHVALRHGTNQASKAYLGQMGLGVMGGLLSKEGSSAEKSIGAVGGFGMNALFLKFSRTDEEQADVVGAQMMARAGYDPQDMVSFFEIMRSLQSRDPGRGERFFSSHPAPKDRAARIRTEMTSLAIHETAPTAGFKQAKAALLKLPPALSTQQIAQANGTGGATAAASPSQAPTSSGSRVAELNVEPSSSTFRSFQQRNGLFQVNYPENWLIYQPANGYGVTLAPPGGFVDSGGEENDLVYGVIINHYDPIDREVSTRFANQPDNDAYAAGFVDGNGRVVSRTSLALATNDLISQILRSNSDLKLVADSQRVDTISGASALSLVLSGRSPVTRQEERVTVFTRELSDDDVIYALFIAPGVDYSDSRATFNRIIASLQVNDSARHP